MIQLAEIVKHFVAYLVSGEIFAARGSICVRDLSPDLSCSGMRRTGDQELPLRAGWGRPFFPARRSKPRRAVSTGVREPTVRLVAVRALFPGMRLVVKQLSS